MTASPRLFRFQFPQPKQGYHAIIVFHLDHHAKVIRVELLSNSIRFTRLFNSNYWVIQFELLFADSSILP